jgi:small subunit ribosomal protein S13
MAEDKRKQAMEENDNVTLVRVLGKDIRGDKKVAAGITGIKGISWAFSNAVCKCLELDGNKKIQELTKEELAKLEEFANHPKIPGFLKNRQRDFEDGEDKHLLSVDLKLRNEFDVKRLRKIKSYKGSRHAAGLPVRGQRTRANFRKNRKKSGATGGKKK